MRQNHKRQAMLNQLQKQQHPAHQWQKLILKQQNNQQQAMMNQLQKQQQPAHQWQTLLCQFPPHHLSPTNWHPLVVQGPWLKLPAHQKHQVKLKHNPAVPCLQHHLELKLLLHLRYLSLICNVDVSVFRLALCSMFLLIYLRMVASHPAVPQLQHLQLKMLLYLRHLSGIYLALFRQCNFGKATF